MKKKVSQSTPGFVLVLTLIILSIMVVMVTQLFNRARVHFYFDRAMVDREKAKMLAKGGIQLAIDQLSLPPSPEKEEKGAEQKKTEDPALLFLKKNLPFINLWQEFSLKGDIDGMEGIVKFCIMSEDGKIDINQLFDFSAKKFLNEGAATQDSKKALSALFASAKKFLNDKNLFEPFEKFLKQRQYKLQDITELLAIEEFQSVFKDKVFYEPSVPTKKEQQPVYLTDIFTIWSHETTMNPWLLSYSISTLYGLKRAATIPEEVLKNIKSVSGDIKTIWEQSLEKLYAKEFKAIPTDLAMLLANKFHAKTFSVLSYGTVGNITQKVFAIVEAQDPVTFMIKKLYWL